MLELVWKMKKEKKKKEEKEKEEEEEKIEKEVEDESKKSGRMFAFNQDRADNWGFQILLGRAVYKKITT